MRAGRTLPIYLSAGAFFAAIAARGFLVPLRAHELGADRFQVGLLFSVATLAGAALSLPAGLLADRFGRRSMVLFSAITGGASQVLIATSTSVPLDDAWQVIGGLGGGAAQAALFAALADAVPAARLGRAMGWLTLAMQVGFLGGPALGGFLLNFMDLRAALAVTTVMYLLPLGLAPLISGARSATASWDLVTPLREMARRRGFPAAVLAMFGATIVWGTVQAYLPLFGKEALGLSGPAIGYMLAVQAVFNGLSRVPGGRIVDRAERKGVIVAVGIVGYAFAVLLLPHLGGFWAPTILLSAAVPLLATAYVALSVTFSSLAPRNGMGVAMGLYGSVLFLGLGVGPAVFGEVMNHSGYVAGFTACGVTAIAIAVVGLLVRAYEPALRRRPAVVMPPPSPGT
ncbi:MAG TPA: MFS transporter [Candidatus Dormibacteraeota bacterium]|jgi:MFS family permease